MSDALPEPPGLSGAMFADDGNTPEPELPWTPAPTSEALVVRDPQDTPLDEAIMTPRGVQWFATVFKESGMFPGNISKAQAVVKILAGRELGIGPFEAMRSIHIVNGAAALSAGAVAARVKRSGRYNFKPLKTEADECVIEWWEIMPNGRDMARMGTSRFTIEDAQRAGLTRNPSWTKYPVDMLFARALTAGARRFAPDCFGMGAIYTPEELGAGVPDDDEGIAFGEAGGAG